MFATVFWRNDLKRIQYPGCTSSQHLRMKHLGTKWFSERDFHRHIFTIFIQMHLFDCVLSTLENTTLLFPDLHCYAKPHGNRLHSANFQFHPLLSTEGHKQVSADGKCLPVTHLLFGLVLRFGTNQHIVLHVPNQSEKQMLWCCCISSVNLSSLHQESIKV